MTAGTVRHWMSGYGSPGIRSFWLETAGTASSGKAVGSESNWYDRRALGQTLDRLTGQWASGHQHQVIWLDSGQPRQSGKAWSPSQQARQWHPVIRYTDCLGSTAGIYSGHQASGHLACQRAPRHLARQWAPSHQVRQRASESNWHDKRAPDQVPDFIWINSGHRVNW
ncbi:unnamed protein product, partial [Staurois parvus]